MPLSNESEEIAELKYELALQRIQKRYEELTRRNQSRYQTTIDKEQEKLKLLPLRLEETARALLDCYFERFEADGLIPEQSDLERLDRKIENIFCGGFGDYTGSLSLDITSEIDRLEIQAQKQLKVRTLELKLRKPMKATYETNINQNYAPLQQGPNNTQNITGIHTINGKPHIRWSQLKPEVGVHRVSGVGDVEVTEQNIKEALEIGGDPWVDICEATAFGAVVRKYALGFFTPE